MPSLAAVINGLPLVSLPTSLAPLEAQPVPTFADAFNRRVLTSIGVVQCCLPLLRQSREADGVVLTLISSATARVSLPFRAIESASDAALVAAMDSLRREVLLSENVKGGVRIVNLDIGFFHLPSSSMKQQPQQTENDHVTLPGHLRGIYSPALERRLVVSSDRGGARHGRRKSDTSKLAKKVFNIIIKGRGGRRSHVGAGCAFLKTPSCPFSCMILTRRRGAARTYYCASLLPAFLVDYYLAFQDTLACLVARRRASAIEHASAKTAPTRTGAYVNVKGSSSESWSSDSDAGLDSSVPDLLGSQTLASDHSG
jgi:NAD(P)-dependent dehydrogenase (short-subunit alcohol dehydrogenase family)